MGVARNLAAAIVVFAAGLLVGRVAPRATPPPTEGTGRYVLLLHETPGAAELGAEETAERVSEYRAWARGLRTRGRLEAGEKLVRAAAVVGGPAAVPPTVSGFFVIRAASDEDALTLARDCPHARRGGAVEVRKIDTPPARTAREEAR
jgi:hypothetical protein